jgi:endoglucanase
VDDVTVTAGSQGLSSWTVTFTWPGDQKITSAWGANETQSGQSVTLTNESYNGTVAAGASLTNVGVQGTYTSSNTLPSSVSCHS